MRHPRRKTSRTSRTKKRTVHHAKKGGVCGTSRPRIIETVRKAKITSLRLGGALAGEPPASRVTVVSCLDSRLPYALSTSAAAVCHRYWVSVLNVACT